MRWESLVGLWKCGRRARKGSEWTERVEKAGGLGRVLCG